MTTGGHDNWNASPFLVMPYCMPGAGCWPKPEVWSAFNQSIDGMLHGPPGRAHPLPAPRSPHPSFPVCIPAHCLPFSHRSEYIADRRTVRGSTW